VKSGVLPCIVCTKLQLALPSGDVRHKLSHTKTILDFLVCAVKKFHQSVYNSLRENYTFLVLRCQISAECKKGWAGSLVSSGVAGSEHANISLLNCFSLYHLELWYL
jgi:hypothetical protein